MRTLDQILTKKDYSRKTPASLFYKDSPLWQKLLTIGCVVFLAGAGRRDISHSGYVAKPRNGFLTSKFIELI